MTATLQNSHVRAHFVLLLVAAALAFSAVPHSCAEDADAEAKIKKAMQRKVSFEFVDTPLTDAIKFVSTITNINIIIDPKVLEKNPPAINLRVTDMNVDVALEWILKLAELAYVVKDNTVFISSPDMIKEVNQRLAQDKQKKGAGGENTDGILRVRFASGDMIEVDGTMLKRMPQLSQELMSMVFDPVRDEVLVLAAGRDIPGHISNTAFMEAAKHIAPDAKISVDDKLRILMVTSNDEGDLRKINALARGLRKAGGMDMPFGPGKGPPPWMDKGPGGGPGEMQPQNPGRNKVGKPGEPMQPPRPPDTAKDQF